jgi:cbb3-type cytochrome oxidase subunit 3
MDNFLNLFLLLCFGIVVYFIYNILKYKKEDPDNYTLKDVEFVYRSFAINPQI